MHGFVITLTRFEIVVVLVLDRSDLTVSRTRKKDENDKENLSSLWRP